MFFRFAVLTAVHLQNVNAKFHKVSVTFIEPYQVAHKLSRLNTYKAPGPDGLPTWLLKECAAYLSCLLYTSDAADE